MRGEAPKAMATQKDRCLKLTQNLSAEDWSLLSVSESFTLHCFHLPLCFVISTAGSSYLPETWDPSSHLLVLPFIAYLAQQQLCPETIFWSVSFRLEIIICCALREALTSARVIPSLSNDISITCSKANSLSLPVILLKMPIFILLNAFTERYFKAALPQQIDFVDLFELTVMYFLALLLP